MIFSGNPWPPVVPHKTDLKNSLINILLKEAKKDFQGERWELRLQADRRAKQEGPQGEDREQTETVKDLVNKISTDSPEQNKSECVNINKDS